MPINSVASRDGGRRRARSVSGTKPMKKGVAQVVKKGSRPRHPDYLYSDDEGYEEQQNKNDALDAQSDDEDSDEPDPGRRTRSASRRCLPERRGRSRKGSRGERPPSAAGPLGVQKKPGKPGFGQGRPRAASDLGSKVLDLGPSLLVPKSLDPSKPSTHLSPGNVTYPRPKRSQSLGSTTEGLADMSLSTMSGTDSHGGGVTASFNLPTYDPRHSPRMVPFLPGRRSTTSSLNFDAQADMLTDASSKELSPTPGSTVLPDGSVNGLTLPSIKIEKIDGDDTLNHQEQTKDGNRSDDDSLFIPEVSGLSTIPYRM